MTDNMLDYQWPACVACGKDLWVSEAGRFCCRPCEIKTAKRLTELPILFVELNRTAALVGGARKPDTATSGSRTPPIPPRLEVLDLTGPGGVAARLAAVEDAWRTALGWTVAPWRGSPVQAVPGHVKFLINNLPWAVDSYDSIGQDIDDLRRIHAETTAAVNRDRKPGRVQTGLCPAPLENGHCGQQLTATTASHRIRCQTCGTEWDGLAAWRDLRQAQEAILRRDAGVAA